MRINFFGDFVCQNPSKLKLGDSLSEYIENADFNVINFEAPIKNKTDKPIPKSGPNIHQPKESAKWLEDHNFNCIALSNNHLLDFGKEGANNTIKSFSKSKTFGCGDWGMCYEPLILEKDGVKVAIFSTTHREFSCIEDYDGFGCAWMNAPEFLLKIKEIRSKVNYIIICNHGGLEYCNIPLPQYRKLYKFWIDFGVDAIIASHPHVPQGWEIYNGKPIIYSLGNFCFEKTDGNYPPFWNNSLCVNLNLSPDKIQFHVLPITFTPSINTISIEEDQIILNHIENLNSILNDADKYISGVRQILPAYYLTYRSMYSMSGFTYMKLGVTMIKDFLRRWLKPNQFKLRHYHHLNMYRCETHKWMMELLIENNNI